MKPIVIAIMLVPTLTLTSFAQGYRGGFLRKGPSSLAEVIGSTSGNRQGGPSSGSNSSASSRQQGSKAPSKERNAGKGSSKQAGWF